MLRGGRRSAVGQGAALGLILLAGLSTPAFGAASCPELYGKGRFGEAARCFESRARAMPHGSKLSKIQRYLKGRRLRNASGVYQKAAMASGMPEVAAFFREKALLLLQQYLDERLCGDAARCAAVARLARGVSGRIGYARLTVLAGEAWASGTVLAGYRFSLRARGKTWMGRLRPGKYTVTVHGKDGRVARSRIVMRPGVDRVVRFTAPRRRVAAVKPKSKAPSLEPKGGVKPARAVVTKPTVPPKGSGRGKLVPWVVGGTGLALVVAGAVFLGAGQAAVSSRDSAYDELKQKAAGATPEERERLAQKELGEADSAAQDAHDAAVGRTTAGWVLMGSGVAALGTATVLYLVRRSRKKGRTAGAPREDRPVRVTAGWWPGGVVVSGSF